MANPIIPLSQPTPLQRQASQFCNQAAGAFGNVVAVFQRGVAIFWGNTPANDASQVQPAFDALAEIGYDG